MFLKTKIWGPYIALNLIKILKSTQDKLKIVFYSYQLIK